MLNNCSLTPTKRAWFNLFHQSVFPNGDKQKTNLKNHRYDGCDPNRPQGLGGVLKEKLGLPVSLFGEITIITPVHQSVLSWPAGGGLGVR